MEKYIYDNSNGLWYELHGDYYQPCLVIPEEESTPSASGAGSTSSISESIALPSEYPLVAHLPFLRKVDKYLQKRLA